MREKLIALSMVKKGDWSEIDKYLQQDSDLNSIDNVTAFQLVDQLNFEVVTMFDADYPEAWRDMAKPPFVVYLQGNRKLLTGKIVAIVGGKRPSEYTKKAVQNLMRKLPADVGVVTGLELGAEVYASDHAKNRLACLASGFIADDFYRKHPAYNQFNNDDLMISEFPPNVKFELQAYFRTYHLLVELSEVVCVFEMPTSDLRMKFLNYLTEVGKQVVVLPDKKTQNTTGGLGLINRGARCLLHVRDVTDLLDD